MRSKGNKKTPLHPILRTKRKIDALKISTTVKKLRQKLIILILHLAFKALRPPTSQRFLYPFLRQYLGKP